MNDLSDFINKWESSALSLREAETLINLLIVDNKRIEADKERLERIKAVRQRYDTTLLSLKSFISEMDVILYENQE